MHLGVAECIWTYLGVSVLFKPTHSQGIARNLSFEASLATVMQTVFDTAQQIFSTGLPRGRRGAHTLNLLHETLYQGLAPSKHGGKTKNKQSFENTQKSNNQFADIMFLVPEFVPFWLRLASLDFQSLASSRRRCRPRVIINTTTADDEKSSTTHSAS